jgi:hypothetical protein
MGSPFPGVDPYLEGQGVWHDFHVGFNVTLREKLMRRLPHHYVARIEEHVYLDDEAGTAISRKVPDVEIEKIGSGPSHQPPPGTAGGVTLLEPVIVPNVFVDPIRVRYVEVRTRSSDEVVTIIETLSPTNKYGSGRAEYLGNRLSLMYEDVNLVELDLLLQGKRIEMGAPIPAADFYALISRGDRRPDCEVYGWGLTHPLPTIPIPLQPPDPDVMLDLQEVFSTTFERGPYDRLVRYAMPVGLRVTEDRKQWIEERLTTIGITPASSP